MLVRPQSRSPRMGAFRELQLNADHWTGFHDLILLIEMNAFSDSLCRLAVLT